MKTHYEARINCTDKYLDTSTTLINDSSLFRTICPRFIVRLHQRNSQLLLKFASLVSAATMCKEENRRNRRKILGARTRTNQKLNTHVISGRGSSPSDSCGRRALSLATAPRRSPNLCIFLFHFICISLIFNIFILLNSASICCFFFCFNLLSCDKISVESPC